MTTIGDEVFDGCKLLKDIHLHWIEVDTIQIHESAFNDINIEECIIYIPSGTRWAYRHHPVLGKFNNIEIEKRVKNKQK